MISNQHDSAGRPGAAGAEPQPWVAPVVPLRPSLVGFNAEAPVRQHDQFATAPQLPAQAPQFWPMPQAPPTPQMWPMPQMAPMQQTWPPMQQSWPVPQAMPMQQTWPMPQMMPMQQTWPPMQQSWPVPQAMPMPQTPVRQTDPLPPMATLPLIAPIPLNVPICLVMQAPFPAMTAPIPAQPMLMAR